MSVPSHGLHRLPDREYFALPLPSSSETKVLLEGTPAHLAHQRENPREENDAFAVGAYCHALLLDPNSIDDGFIRTGKIDRRTKEGKAEWESVQRRLALSGARAITDDQVALAEAMAHSVRCNPSAASLLNTLSHREVTVIGEIGGRPAKAKADGIITLAGASIVVDIKTTQSAAPGEFARSAATFGYYHQAAWYSRLVSQALAPVDDFIIIAVEKEPPHLCAVYRIPAVTLTAADAHLDRLAATWWRVLEGDRSGYPTTIENLEPPAWWLTAQERKLT